MGTATSAVRGAKLGSSVETAPCSQGKDAGFDNTPWQEHGFRDGKKPGRNMGTSKRARLQLNPLKTVGF
jgi:hypothetical protein